MPGLERLLDRRPLVVDAPVQRAGPEKGALGARLIQNVDQRGRVLVRPVVVRQCQHPRRRALGDDDARVRRALDQLERAGRGDGKAGAGGEEDGHEAGGGEHFGGFVRVVEKRVLEDQAGNGEAPGVISWRHLHRGSGARTSFFWHPPRESCRWSAADKGMVCANGSLPARTGGIRVWPIWTSQRLGPPSLRPRCGIGLSLSFTSAFSPGCGEARG